MTKQNGPTKERELILDILLEILEYGGYSHVVLKKALDKHQYLEKQNRAFITRVAEGTLEYLLTIDAVIDQCSKTKVKKMKPVIRTILRMSVYQILKMDRIPDSAVCDEAVKLAVKRKFHGLKGFVNGVLRTISREKETFLFTDWSRKYSMPDWIIELWKPAISGRDSRAYAAGFPRGATYFCALQSGPGFHGRDSSQSGTGSCHGTEKSAGRPCPSSFRL